MSYDNSGVLFKNKKKETKSQPDYTGSATVNGQEYRISAWIKEGERGKFMSVSFRDKAAQGSRPMDRGVSRRREEMDDDIPF